MDYKKVIVQWKEFETPKFLPRNTEVNPNTDFIVTITGPRRAGKTYLCFQVMDSLLKDGIPKDNILYVNFEDEKLLGAEADDLELLVETFYELSEVDRKRSLYLFFDEIQNVRDWDAWVRRVYDTQKNVKLALTGSSSKLLSREVSTKLRGRVINYEVFPLSFREYLAWKGVRYNLKTLTQSREKIEVKKNYNEFLINGGYPAVVLSDQLPKETVLQSYYESVIFKDVVERHNIKEVKKLRLLANLLFESTSREISYNKLSNKLKSLGLSTSKNTVIDYISHFEDAYLFFQNLRYDYSLAKQLGSIKKVYCIDNGLLNAVSFKFAEDAGKLMENLVYLELRRRGEKIYYHRNKHECDFLIQKKNTIVSAIQVTHSLHEENEDREVNGLIEALETHKLEEGIIITGDQEGERKIKDKTVTITPIWKWLINTPQ